MSASGPPLRRGGGSTELRHQHDDARGADVGRLAAHVGTGDDLERRIIAFHDDVVGDEADAILQLEAGVPRLLENHVARAAGREARPHVARRRVHCHMRQAGPTSTARVQQYSNLKNVA